MNNELRFLSFIFFALINTTFLYAQQQTFKIPDSLKTVEFNELEKRFNSSILDKEKKIIYANTYYLKAKKQSNVIIQSNGLYMKAFSLKNRDQSIKYLDSIVSLTKNLEDFIYPAKAYILKNRLLYANDKLNDALKNILIAEEYAKKANNVEQLVQIKQQIGLLKIELGRPDEALPLVLENYKYYQSKKENSPNFMYTGWIISDIYNRQKKADESLHYTNAFLDTIDNKNPYYKYFLLNKGISYHLKKNYIKSNALLDESTKMIEKVDDPLNLALGYYYRGENELIRDDNFKKAKKYFDKVDSVLLESKKNSYDLRDNYLRLIEISKRINDDNQQLYYLNRLIEIDNYLDKNNIVLSKNVIKHFDKPQLLSQKDEVINKINREKKVSLGVILIIAIGLLLLIFYFIRMKKEKVLLEQKFNELINKSTEEKTLTNVEKHFLEVDISNDSKDLKTKENDLPKEIVRDILNKLSLFEKRGEYISPNIKQIDLAKQLETNSSYLSKVINQYKDKNFSQYINDLRIDYTVNKLKKDKKFRKYTIKAIAEEVGFNNSDSFAKAFYTKVGLQPSYFIKKINEMTEV
ncbi:helix-turn-helix domain-containing protein [Flavobacterium amniphilum]|uniref:helix-turn-helix domain-containing protein n=1 Tax=Flavobacterium amniphilum TaxID=1834035 RepID=UPI00202A3CDC|nr:helix-turn-helix domain-containing protein [Flavobacterium amniphilum]MCL9805870.1 helix-turn-helix domain-containing protein [Flavobacterium amniphilum]